MFVKSSAVKLEASCLGALSLRLLCHSSNTFTAHLVLCWVFLGTVLSKRRRSSSSVFGGRNRRNAPVFLHVDIRNPMCNTVAILLQSIHLTSSLQHSRRVVWAPTMSRLRLEIVKVHTTLPLML